MKTIMALSIVMAIVAMGCSSMKVIIDYDDQFDFSAYRTFAFVPENRLPEKPKPDVIRDPLFEKKAEKEISSILTARGFQAAAAPHQADFLIAYYATARNKATVTPPTYHIGRFGRRWVTPGHVYHYQQGTLIIDIIDREKKELVWRGVGSNVLDRSDPKNNLLVAVEKVLQKFPPKK